MLDLITVFQTLHRHCSASNKQIQGWYSTLRTSHSKRNCWLYIWRGRGAVSSTIQLSLCLDVRILGSWGFGGPAQQLFSWVDTFQNRDFTPTLCFQSQESVYPLGRALPLHRVLPSLQLREVSSETAFLFKLWPSSRLGDSCWVGTRAPSTILATAVAELTMHTRTICGSPWLFVIGKERYHVDGPKQKQFSGSWGGIYWGQVNFIFPPHSLYMKPGL